MRWVRALAVCALLLAPATTASASAEPAPPPAAPQAFAQKADNAVQAIQADLAALVRSHPDLFPTAPPAAWRSASGPSAAFDAAAHTLADHRVRALLRVPDGSNRSGLAPDALAGALATWQRGLQTNASRLMAAVAGVEAPAPGPALEDALAVQLAPFLASAQSHSVAASLPTATLGPDGLSLVLPIVVRVEALRVGWEFMPPPPMQAPAAGEGRLTFGEAKALQDNVSFPLPDSSGFSNGGWQIAQNAVAARDAFTVVAGLAAAEEEYSQWQASVGVIKHQAERVAAEYARLSRDGNRTTLLSLRAQETGFDLLSAAAHGHPADGEALSSALGQFAVVRLMRGLPILRAADLTTSSHAAADGWPVLAALSALGVEAATRSRGASFRRR